MLIDPTYTYLVVDLENQGVLCKAPTASVANAVSLGLINTTTVVLLEYPWTALKPSAVNFEEENKILLLRGVFEKMPKELETEAWTAKKSLAIMRRNFQWAWEGRCVQQLKRAAEFHSPGVFEAYALDQLRECDPEIGKWSMGVLEWASIHDLPAETAYQELKLYMDSLGLTYLRNAAIYTKVVADINKGVTEKEMNTAFHIGRDSMFISKSLL